MDVLLLTFAWSTGAQLRWSTMISDDRHHWARRLSVLYDQDAFTLVLRVHVLFHRSFSVADFKRPCRWYHHYIEQFPAFPVLLVLNVRRPLTTSSHWRTLDIIEYFDMPLSDDWHRWRIFWTRNSGTLYFPVILPSYHRAWSSTSPTITPLFCMYVRMQFVSSLLTHQCELQISACSLLFVDAHSLDDQQQKIAASHIWF